MTLCGEKHSDFKSYMDYKCITSKDSMQYKLIHNGTINVGSDGLLYCGDYVSIALGSRFGNIGDKFIITLDSGKTFKAIKGDEKSDKDTVNHCHHLSDGSLVEFIIDTRLARQSYHDCIRDGNFNSSDKFNGHITKIQKVVSSNKAST